MRWMVTVCCAAGALLIASVGGAFVAITAGPDGGACSTVQAGISVLAEGYGVLADSPAIDQGSNTPPGVGQLDVNRCARLPNGTDGRNEE